MDDPLKCIGVLNKIVLRKVTTAVQEQHEEVYRTGLTSFPKDFLESRRQNAQPIPIHTFNRSMSIPIRALCGTNNAMRLSELNLRVDTPEPIAEPPGEAESTELSCTEEEEQPAIEASESEPEPALSELNSKAGEASPSEPNEVTPNIPSSAPKKTFRAMDPD